MSGNVASSPHKQRTRKDGTPAKGYFTDKGSDKFSYNDENTSFKTNDLFARSLVRKKKIPEFDMGVKDLADPFLSPKDKRRSTSNNLSPSRKVSPMFHIYYLVRDS